MELDLEVGAKLLKGEPFDKSPGPLGLRAEIAKTILPHDDAVE